MRREQEQRERRSRLLVMGAAVAAGVLVIGLAVWQLLERDRRGDTALPDIGLPSAEAGCGEPVVEIPEGTEVSGVTGVHAVGEVPLTYRFSPPAFGRHWEVYLGPAQVREFWETGERPPVERLVHSLEHGWTILWYDDEVAADEEQLEQLQAVADHFAGAAADEQKLMVAPFSAEDEDTVGEPFPAGQHLALTHWSVAGNAAVAGGQQGVWQYCEQVSGEAVATFTDTYTWADAPEPGAY
jgi:Protein of unknown function (DUF3105)